MRVAPLLLLAAACGGGPTGPTATVIAEAGNDPAGGTYVISHRPDGEVIDEVQAEGDGHADVVIEDGALVSVVFAARAEVAIVTTLAPAEGGQLVVHGPPAEHAPTTAGALAVTPDQPLAADAYELRLGCATIDEAALPATVNVASSCLGSDATLDVLARAYLGSPHQLVGYVAGRVPLVGGVATFEPAGWETTGPTVPVTLDEVAPALAWTLVSDGLPILTEPLADPGQLYTGLTVDAVTITATLGDASAAQVTTERRPGVPDAIELGPSDFLAPVAPGLALDVASPPALSWTAADIGADAVDLHLAWTVAGRPVTWDAVLPPDAAAAVFPAIGDDAVAGMLGPSDATPAARLRYLDSSELDGFAALAAAGLDVTDPTAPTIAAPPADGEIRTSEAAAAP